MFITYTINAPSEVFLLCSWRDEIVDKAPVDGDEDDDVLANAGWYKNMINILNQFNKNYQVKIKTYIQARRYEFSNNWGGVGLLGGGGGGWLLELLLGVGVGGVGIGVGVDGVGVGGVGVGIGGVGVGFLGVVSIIAS